MELDINLYSRQIGTYGLETMELLIKQKIYIYGIGGVKQFKNTKFLFLKIFYKIQFFLKFKLFLKIDLYCNLLYINLKSYII